jgi:Tfp pilus assembly protein PilO
MGARRIDQLWLLGGVVTIIALVAATWFLGVSPVDAEKETLQTQTEDTRGQLTKLNHEIADLSEKKKQLATFKTQLTTKQNALPTKYNTTDFLRQLQITAATVHVEVSGMTVGAPAKSTVVSSAVELPISLTADGTPANLSRFLAQLQTVQPRAVLITMIAVATGAEPGTVTATLNLNAYCAPPTDIKVPNTCLASD